MSPIPEHSIPTIQTLDCCSQPSIHFFHRHWPNHKTLNWYCWEYAFLNHYHHNIWICCWGWCLCGSLGSLALCILDFNAERQPWPFEHPIILLNRRWNQVHETGLGLDSSLLSSLPQSRTALNKILSHRHLLPSTGRLQRVCSRVVLVTRCCW